MAALIINLWGASCNLRAVQDIAYELPLMKRSKRVLVRQTSLDQVQLDCHQVAHVFELSTHGWKGCKKQLLLRDMQKKQEKSNSGRRYKYDDIPYTVLIAPDWIWIVKANSSCTLREYSSTHATAAYTVSTKIFTGYSELLTATIQAYLVLCHTDDW